jgi:hypothetical protein
MARKFSDTEIPIVSVEEIGQRIYLVRGLKVMLSADLASLYQVSTRRLNESVKRNRPRFPEDFVFQLNKAETDDLAFQIGMPYSSASLKSRTNLKYRPYAFTEHGVAMLSSVLNARAIQMNILIIRALVKLRELLATNKDLAARLERLEQSHEHHTSVINILAEIDGLHRGFE